MARSSQQPVSRNEREYRGAQPEHRSIHRPQAVQSSVLAVASGARDRALAVDGRSLALDSTDHEATGTHQQTVRLRESNPLDVRMQVMEV